MNNKGSVDHRFDPDSSMTAAQQQLVSALTLKQLEKIDHILMCSASTQWQKQAKIIGEAMQRLHEHAGRLPDAIYSQRLALLVQQKKLLLAGDIGRMRFSELKLPA